MLWSVWLFSLIVVLLLEGGAEVFAARPAWIKTCDQDLAFKQWRVFQYYLQGAGVAKAYDLQCPHYDWLQHFAEISPYGSKVFVDVGAHKGHVSLLFLQLWAPQLELSHQDLYLHHKKIGKTSCGVCHECHWPQPNITISRNTVGAPFRRPDGTFSTTTLQYLKSHARWMPMSVPAEGAAAQTSQTPNPGNNQQGSVPANIPNPQPSLSNQQGTSSTNTPNPRSATRPLARPKPPHKQALPGSFLNSLRVPFPPPRRRPPPPPRKALRKPPTNKARPASNADEEDYDVANTPPLATVKPSSALSNTAAQSTGRPDTTKPAPTTSAITPKADTGVPAVKEQGAGAQRPNSDTQQSEVATDTVHVADAAATAGKTAEARAHEEVVAQGKDQSGAGAADDYEEDGKVDQQTRPAGQSNVDQKEKLGDQSRKQHAEAKPTLDQQTTTNTAAAVQPNTAAAVQPDPAAAVLLNTAAAAQPDAAAAVQPNTAAAVQPHPAAAVLLNTAAAVQPDTAAAVQPNTAAAVQPNTAAAVQPDPAAVVQPGTTAAVLPDTAAAVQPSTTAAGQSNTAAAVLPAAAAAGQPDTAAAGQPDTAAAIQSNTAAAVQPDTAAAGQPGTTAAVQPDTAAAVQPGTTAAVQPSTAAAVQPGSTAAVQPDTAAAVQPGTTAAVQPDTAAAVQPDTAAAVQPGTTAAVQPDTAATVQPGTTAAVQPDPAAVQPTTASEVVEKVKWGSNTAREPVLNPPVDITWTPVGPDELQNSLPIVLTNEEKKQARAREKAAATSKAAAQLSSTPAAGNNNIPAAGANSTPTASDSSTPTASDNSSPAASDNSIPAASDNSSPAASDNSIPAAGANSTPAASDNSTPAAGDNSTPAAGDNSTPAASDNSTPAAGDNSSTIESTAAGTQPPGSGTTGTTSHASSTGDTTNVASVGDAAAQAVSANNNGTKSKDPDHGSAAPDSSAPARRLLITEQEIRDKVGSVFDNPTVLMSTTTDANAAAQPGTPPNPGSIPQTSGTQVPAATNGGQAPQQMALDAHPGALPAGQQMTVYHSSQTRSEASGDAQQRSQGDTQQGAGQALGHMGQTTQHSTQQGAGQTLGQMGQTAQHSTQQGAGQTLGQTGQPTQHSTQQGAGQTIGQTNQTTQQALFTASELLKLQEQLQQHKQPQQDPNGQQQDVPVIDLATLTTLEQLLEQRMQQAAQNSSNKGTAAGSELENTIQALQKVIEQNMQQLQVAGGSGSSSTKGVGGPIDAGSAGWDAGSQGNGAHAVDLPNGGKPREGGATANQGDSSQSHDVPDVAVPDVEGRKGPEARSHPLIDGVVVDDTASDQQESSRGFDHTKLPTSITLHSYESSRYHARGLQLAERVFFEQRQQETWGIRWNIHQKALLDRPGYGWADPDCFADVCHVTPGDEGPVQQTAGQQMKPLPVSTIDAEIGTLGVQTIDVLKIDTSGDEVAVLVGAKKTLRQGRVGVLVFDYGLPGVWNEPLMLRKVLQMLARGGMACYFAFGDEYFRLTGCWRPEYDFHAWATILCVHHEHVLYEYIDSRSLASKLKNHDWSQSSWTTSDGQFGFPAGSMPGKASGADTVER